MSTYRAAYWTDGDAEVGLTTVAHAGIHRQDLIADAKVEMERAGLSMGDGGIEVGAWAGKETVTYRDVVDAMREHDRSYALGSESAQWQDFLAAFLAREVDPFDENNLDMEPDDDFAPFWQAISARDFEMAEGLGEVPILWRPIGDQLRRARKTLGMTQKDVAESWEMQENSIAMIERGERNPSGPTRTLIRMLVDEAF